MRKKPVLRLPALLLAVCLLAGLLPLQRAAAADPKSSISYRVEGDTLIFSGTGWIYTANLPPRDIRNQVKHVIVQPGITRLVYRFMDFSTNLETVTLPEGLECIEASSFADCTNLKSINIPSTVTNIYSDAFSRCSSLKSIKLPAGLKTIGSGVFYKCTGLTSIDLPAGLEELGSNAFADCTGITSIALPQGLQKIGAGALQRLRHKADHDPGQRCRSRGLTSQLYRPGRSGDLPGHPYHCRRFLR